MFKFIKKVKDICVNIGSKFMIEANEKLQSRHRLYLFLTNFERFCEIALWYNVALNMSLLPIGKIHAQSQQKNYLLFVLVF